MKLRLLVVVLLLFMTDFSAPFLTPNSFGQGEESSIFYDGTFGLSVAEELFGQEGLTTQDVTGEEFGQGSVNFQEIPMKNAFEQGPLDAMNFDTNPAAKSGLAKRVGSSNAGKAEGEIVDFGHSAPLTEGVTDIGLDLGLLGDKSFDINAAVESGLVRRIGSLGGSIAEELGNTGNGVSTASLVEGPLESGWELGILGDRNFDITAAVESGIEFGGSSATEVNESGNDASFAERPIGNGFNLGLHTDRHFDFNSAFQNGPFIRIGDAAYTGNSRSGIFQQRTLGIENQRSRDIPLNWGIWNHFSTV